MDTEPFQPSHTSHHLPQALTSVSHDPLLSSAASTSPKPGFMAAGPGLRQKQHYRHSPSLFTSKGAAAPGWTQLLWRKSQPFPLKRKIHPIHAGLGQHSPVDNMLCWRDCTQLAALPLAGPSPFLTPQFPHKNKALSQYNVLLWQATAAAEPPAWSPDKAAPRELPGGGQLKPQKASQAVVPNSGVQVKPLVGSALHLPPARAKKSRETHSCFLNSQSSQ